MDTRGVSRFVAFFAVSAGLAVAPGPDILFVLAQSLQQGAFAAWCVVLGLCSGLVVHVSLAAFGFGAVVKRCPRLFTAITWCGAAYLVFLGVEAWQSASLAAANPAAVETLAPLRLYARGVVMNLCNPKVILFFLALVPRFVVREHGRVALQFILLGLIFAAAAMMVLSAVAIGGGFIAECLSRSPNALPLLQRIAAAVMLGLAGFIVWSNRGRRPAQRAVVSLGSNISPRADYLRRAVAALAALPETKLVKASSVIETEPVDVPTEFADQKFLNQIAVYETRLEVHEFARRMHAVEDALGRERTVRNGPRTIDLDLIDFDGLRLSTPELTLPHPRAHLREFVRVPLEELGINDIITGR